MPSGSTARRGSAPQQYNGEALVDVLRRRAQGALLVVAALLLGGCMLELDVNVEVARDGSGSVEVAATLDREAVARVGGDLEAVLALDDLRAVGWTIDGPTTDASGGATVRVRKHFDDSGEAAEVFAEIAGEEGPFQGFDVTRDRSFTRTRWGFRGTVDFSRDVDRVGGLAPAPEVDGVPLADDLGALEDQLGDSLSRLLRVRVGVRLPGDVSSNATTKADNGAVWQVAFGDGAIDLEASGSETRTWSYVLIGAGIAAAVALLVGVLIRIAGRVTASERAGSQP